MAFPASSYSYLALTYLFKNRHHLSTYDITIEFHPIFLHGVTVGSGNTPSWTVPAKGKHGVFDASRSKKYHGLEEMSVPDFFPPWTLLPMRALCYIKAHFSPSTYESTFQLFFYALWVSHMNITLPAPLTDLLTSTSLFTPKEISSILSAASTQKWKDKLAANTQKVLDQGAFGAPWMWVRNEKGEEEPFFGSDRFHFMWTFLGVEWRDVEIVPRGKEGREFKAKL
ncbi:hypothetical protein IFR05_003436 [Cadophora sp. M221]|nr:hypothetical protein IFR05_003436 [Cadophora sp. M221]